MNTNELKHHHFYIDVMFRPLIGAFVKQVKNVCVCYKLQIHVYERDKKAKCQMDSFKLDSSV